MKIKNSVKSVSLTAAVFVMMLIITTLAISTPSAQAQGVVTTQAQFDTSMNNALWSLQWGTGGNIIAKTNGVTAGPQSDSTSLIPGGAPYTSDSLTMSLLFSSENVSVSVTDANVPSLSWNRNYSISSSGPITSLLFGANYFANNDESLTIGSLSINNIPIPGTVTVNGSQDFSGMLVNFATPITSLSCLVSVSTPSTWERVNAGEQALLGSFAIPSATVVPEPSTYALMGIAGLLFSIMKFRKNH